MSFEREEHDELLERRLLDGQEQRRPQLERSLMAGAAMENLTGSADWDFFLNGLAEMIAAARAVVKNCDSTLRGPVVNHDALLSAKLERAEAAGMLTALEYASGLPKQIIERAKQSREALAT